MLKRILIGFLVLVVAGLSFAAVVAVIRYQRPIPAPQLQLTAPPQLSSDTGAPASLPALAQGSLALEADLDGTLAAVAAEQPRPIGSVAKTMTALVVLEAHPLDGGDGAPYTINAHDVALLRQARDGGGSYLDVSLGEHFTERQMLLALMLRSANNLAETLAIWIDGSRAAFIAHLNTRAAALGMKSSHFDDPSGFSDSTVASASDLLLLGKAALADPALAAIVATQSADMPDGAAVQNLDTDLGSQPGWLGIKTGSTTLAGGCLLFAASRTPPGGSTAVRVIGAILGQADLAAALSGAAQIAEKALAGYTSIDLAAVDPRVQGTVDAPWGDTSHVTTVPVSTSTVTVRQGARLELRTSSASLTAPLAVGAVVATASAWIHGHILATWNVTTTLPIGEPSFWWRLTH